MEELQLHAQLVAVGTGRLQVFVGLRIVVDHANDITAIGILARSIVESQLIGIGIATHLCPGSTHLTIVQEALVLDELREHHAARERGVEIDVMIKRQRR